MGHRRAEQTPGLHVYGQYAWHDDVEIVGAADALLALSEVLREAAKRGYGEVDMQPRDGEGYTVRVLRVEGVDGLPLPYFAEHAADNDAERWGLLRVLMDLRR